MNKEKPYFLKRAVAYLIDLIIVVLLAGILSSIFIKSESYRNETQKLVELTAKYSSGEITKEEYSEELDDVNYYLAKDGVGVTIISVSVSMVYYVVLCYFCGGITLGKYIMKLRIVSANEKVLNLGNFLIRGLLVNLILSNLVNIIMVFALNKEQFTAVYSKVSSGLTIFLLITLAVMMYREDGRGLHDLAANTKIVSTKCEKKNIEIEEAEVVEEQTIQDEKKKTTKKKAKKGVK